MAENGGAERARDKADRIDRERFEHADQRIGFREEQLAENEPGDDAVEEKVVPFDGGADGARDDGAAQLTAMRSLRATRPTQCRPRPWRRLPYLGALSAGFPRPGAISKLSPLRAALARKVRERAF